MILANGKLYDHEQQNHLLSHLEAEINATRAHLEVDTKAVISALDAIALEIEEKGIHGVFPHVSMEISANDVYDAIRFFKGDSLTERLQRELGIAHIPFKRQGSKSEALDFAIHPLGTLLHIAAGNQEGLPVYSVIEGLMTGNVNIVKLPSGDGGLSVMLLEKLIGLCPSVAPFLYVFDTPSTDMDALINMAEMADGIVVWGGDEAVKAVRHFAPCGAKLIEWGHKLSFAYISGYENKEVELSALAKHIITTKQALCSSCQVIYIDTESMEVLSAFCQCFLPYLEAEARKVGQTMGQRAEISLKRYSDHLSKIVTEGNEKAKTYESDHCTLVACGDDALEVSSMYGTYLVKALPQGKIFSTLRKKKHYLQTVGLICSKEQRPALLTTFGRLGACRITRGGDMSHGFLGEAHDGEYALRRYTRVVDIQK